MAARRAPHEILERRRRPARATRSPRHRRDGLERAGTFRQREADAPLPRPPAPARRERPAHTRQRPLELRRARLQPRRQSRLVLPHLDPLDSHARRRRLDAHPARPRRRGALRQPELHADHARADRSDRGWDEARPGALASGLPHVPRQSHPRNLRRSRACRALRRHHENGGRALTPEGIARAHEREPEHEEISGDELLDAEIHLTTDTGEGGKRRGWLFYLHILAFVFGAALLFFLIRAVGVEPIFDALRQIGVGFLLLLVIAGLRHVLRTISMSLAVAPEHRRFTFWEAYTTRLAGETISFFTFTGPVLGEATKAALLRKRVPLSSGVQALAVDNLLYNLSVAFFISSGACVMLLTYDLPVGARLPLIAIAAGMTLVIVVVAFAVVSDVMPVTAAVDYFIRRGFKRNWFASKREHFHRIEENVYDFYKHRPAAFFTMFACDLLAHATTAAEVFIILGMLGFEPSARVAYIIDSLTKVINLVFGFVPATIAMYEGGTGFILHTLGYAVATGVTIGIVRKASMIVWALLGLASLVSHTAPSAMRKVFQRHPRLREVMDNLVLSNMTHRPARTFVSILGVGVGVLLIAFTVGLAHGVLRERGRRESEVGAEIMVRASGTTGIGVTQRFTLPVSRADEIQKIEGVRIAAPIGQTTDASESGFGMRVIDGIQFERYAQLSGIHVTEGRGLQGGDEAIVDSSWKEQHKVRIGDTVKVYGRDFRIVGVYEPPGGGRVKIPLSTMQDQ